MHKVDMERMQSWLSAGKQSVLCVISLPGDVHVRIKGKLVRIGGEFIVKPRREGLEVRFTPDSPGWAMVMGDERVVLLDMENGEGEI